MRQRGHSFFIISLTLFWPKKKERIETRANLLITYRVDTHHHHQKIDDEVVVLLMYLDIVVVVYPNHSLVVENPVDHVMNLVAIVIDLLVIDVDMDALIEDLKKH